MRRSANAGHYVSGCCLYLIAAAPADVSAGDVAQRDVTQPDKPPSPTSHCVSAGDVAQHDVSAGDVAQRDVLPDVVVQLDVCWRRMVLCRV